MKQQSYRSTVHSRGSVFVGDKPPSNEKEEDRPKVKAPNSGLGWFGRITTFSFVNDCSWEYNHNLEVYLSKFNVMSIESDAGSRYFVTSERNWSDVRLIKYVKQIMIPREPSLESFSTWNDNEGLSEFSYYVFDSAYNYTGLKRFRRCEAVVEDNFVTRITEYAMRVNDQKFNVIELYSFACSVASRVIVNGTVVRFDSLGLGPLELMHLIKTIYVTEYVHKFEMGLTLQALLTEERGKRGCCSWMEALTSFVKDKLSWDVRDADSPDLSGGSSLPTVKQHTTKECVGSDSALLILPTPSN